MKKLLIPLVLLFLFSGCGYTQEDIDKAYEDGYDSGHYDGYREGYDEAEFRYAGDHTRGYEEGFEDGYQQAEGDLRIDEMERIIYEYWWGYSGGYDDGAAGREYGASGEYMTVAEYNAR